MTPSNPLLFCWFHHVSPYASWTSFHPWPSTMAPKGSSNLQRRRRWLSSATSRDEAKVNVVAWWAIGQETLKDVPLELCWWRLRVLPSRELTYSHPVKRKIILKSTMACYFSQRQIKFHWQSDLWNLGASLLQLVSCPSFVPGNVWIATLGKIRPICCHCFCQRSFILQPGRSPWQSHGGG